MLSHEPGDGLPDKGIDGMLSTGDRDTLARRLPRFQKFDQLTVTVRDIFDRRPDRTPFLSQSPFLPGSLDPRVADQVPGMLKNGQPFRHAGLIDLEHLSRRGGIPRLDE